MRMASCTWFMLRKKCLVHEHGRCDQPSFDQSISCGLVWQAWSIWWCQTTRLSSMATEPKGNSSKAQGSSFWQICTWPHQTYLGLCFHFIPRCSNILLIYETDDLSRNFNTILRGIGSCSLNQVKGPMELPADPKTYSVNLLGDVSSELN